MKIKILKTFLVLSCNKIIVKELKGDLKSER
nr:MAG TPA: hypothetical protein [Caudoviricetes sp.]